jgi:coproporphyrinogen dehydrogenase HemZ
MIVIQLNKEDFEYDTHSLVRSFYSGEEVVIHYADCAKKVQPGRIFINIEYEAQQITITFEEEGIVVLKDAVVIDYYKDRKETKNHLKRLLYDLLVKQSGIVLPWGTLTGIRPVKIPVAQKRNGLRDEEVVQSLKETYLLSDEKAQLCVSIANKEINLLKDIDYENGYSVYVGIPFCPSICLYCSFSSYPLKIYEKKIEAYLDALCYEIECISKEVAHKKLDTIYLGGGTPTTLSPAQLDRLLFKLEECFDRTYLKELTVEAGRPDSITKEKLEILKKHQVSRISINPQTMKEETLQIIGRKHTADETREAFALARELGFDNINMDLIVGLPGESMEDVRCTLEEITELDPDSVTIHSLAVKRAARLNMFRDKYKELSFVNNKEIMDMAAEYAHQMHMEPYYLYRQKNMTGNFENVGYAKVDKAGIYNILIMEEVQSIIAFGAGAATKLVSDCGNKINRVENVKDVDLYIARIDEMVDRKKAGLAFIEN